MSRVEFFQIAEIGDDIAPATRKHRALGKRLECSRDAPVAPVMRTNFRTQSLSLHSGIVPHRKSPIMENLHLFRCARFCAVGQMPSAGLAAVALVCLRAAVNGLQLIHLLRDCSCRKIAWVSGMPAMEQTVKYERVSFVSHRMAMY